MLGPSKFLILPQLPKKSGQKKLKNNGLSWLAKFCDTLCKNFSNKIKNVTHCNTFLPLQKQPWFGQLTMKIQLFRWFGFQIFTDLCWDNLSLVKLGKGRLMFDSKSQSNKTILVFNKSKLVLNYLTVCYVI